MKSELLTLATVVAFVACGGKAEPVDLSGNWSGTVELVDDLPIEIHLTIPPDEYAKPGTWSLEGRFGQGDLIVRTAQPGSVTIRFNQIDPCPGSFDVQGVVLDNQKFQGSLDGHACDGDWAGSIRFERDAAGETTTTVAP